MLSVAPHVQVVSRSQATLLGAPIGDIISIDTCILDKITKLEIMGERLSLLSSHDSFLLLRHSLCIQKILYILRTAPCFIADKLHTFDNSLRSILSDILNVNLASDSAWVQASLPVRVGGIGIRQATQLASSAYLASATGCLEIIPKALPTNFGMYPTISADTALKVWSQGHSEPPPNPPDAAKQRVWDSVKVKASYRSLLESASTEQGKARLLAVACPESGAWLMSAPISALGLRMDDDDIRVAAGLRLGLPLCRPHT